jgi:DNA polymerase-4
VPNLPIIPGDPRKYADITHRFLKILHEHCDAVEQFSTDEAFADITTAAQDKMGALFLAQRLRSDIVRIIGVACTASIGIAPNKVVAKLASESVKPNGITFVGSDEVLEFLASRKIDDVCGIGSRLKKRLESIGVTSILSLRSTPKELLIRSFGSHTGLFLWNTARGIGDDHIVSEDEGPKSVGHSYTFPRDLLTIDDIHRNLLALADMVAFRLRAQHLGATSVSAFARYGSFGSTGVSTSFSEPIANGLTLFQSIIHRFERSIDLDRGVRLLGITAHGLAPMSTAALFTHDKKMLQATTALDAVANKYGASAWHRASTMNTAFLERVSGWHYDAPH